MPGDRALQLRQPAVEEMAAAGEHDDRQLLRPRPREHVGERHDVVLLAVDDDRVGGHRRRRAKRRTAGPTSTRRSAATVCATRVCTNEPNEKPASTTGSVAEARSALRVRERRERVGGLADAVVERASRLADAAEIEAHAGVAQREERLGERLRDLVVERAALQRMRMRDERDAARRVRRGR